MFPTWRSAGTRPGPGGGSSRARSSSRICPASPDSPNDWPDVGRDGAEVVKDIINSVFEPCVAAVLAERGDVVKFAGDGLMCCFHGADHHVRAARAAAAMQRAVRLAGRATTPAGPARVSISIGVETGPVLCLMARAHRDELMLTGPTVDAMFAVESVSPTRPGTRRRRVSLPSFRRTGHNRPEPTPIASSGSGTSTTCRRPRRGRRGAVSMPAGCSLRNCVR